jgi:hypothetical protein
MVFGSVSFGVSAVCGTCLRHPEDELRAELDRERALLAEHTLDNPRKTPGKKTPDA